MQRSSSPLASSALFILLALPSALAGVGFNCEQVVSDGITWNLKSLGGPHRLHWTHEVEPVVQNYTLTLDICQPLKRTKGIPAKEECPTGSRICAIETITEEGRNDTTIGAVIPIAGDFGASHGKAMDSALTRLRNSESHDDSEKEGIRVALTGSNYDGKEQKAIIEFLCDKERTGLEGDEKDDSDKDDSDKKDRRSEDDSSERLSGSSLRFISYKDESIKNEVWSVLRLEWKTKYACEKVERGSDDPPSGSGWGFFSWLIIILFVGIAAYLIFGSWMNYSRYGARGWDLLPHGDTIRDIPYLMKDFGRRVVSTVQGGGSRGGYSAL